MIETWMCEKCGEFYANKEIAAGCEAGHPEMKLKIKEFRHSQMKGAPPTVLVVDVTRDIPGLGVHTTVETYERVKKK